MNLIFVEVLARFKVKTAVIERKNTKKINKLMDIFKPYYKSFENKQRSSFNFIRTSFLCVRKN